MNVKQAQVILNKNGFPAGSPDGVMGPKTKAALKRMQQASTLYLYEPDGSFTQASAYALRWLPKLSKNFKAAEFASKGNGDCYVRKELVFALEVLRHWRGGTPFRVISGYRDPAHNRKVGGAGISLHTYAEKKPLRGYALGGTAVDLSRRLNLKLEDVKALRVFSGIGFLEKTKRVTHVDCGHVVGRRGSVDNPSAWAYRE